MRTPATASLLLLLAACGGGGGDGDGPDGGGGPGPGGDDGGSTPCGAYTPVQPQQLDGLEVWYDAAQGQDGATWADASGHGYDLTCYGPALENGQLSGHPAATFGGQTYCGDTERAPGFATGEGLLIAGVASFTQGGGLIGLSDENNQNIVAISAGTYAAGSVGNNTVQVGGGRYDDDQPHLFLLTRQNGRERLRVDCGIQDEIGLAVDGPVGGQNIFVGAARPKANMGEIVVVRGELTEAQIGGLESYLLAKYLP